MTEQVKRFLDKYFETLNGSKSAIYAGFSEKTSRQQANQMLSVEENENYLSKLREESEIKHGISRDRWLSELEETGFSNIQDFIEEDNSVKDISQIDRQKASAVNSVKKTVIEGDFGVKTTTEFKLNDKLNALEKIGRHFGYFEKDNDQSKSKTTNIINLGSGTKPDDTTIEAE